VDFRILRKHLNSTTVGLILLGAGVTTVVISLSAGMVAYTGTNEFCTSCHEMRVVAEQGWMKSVHYHNPRGVVAGCGDCHIEPELLPMLRTKMRDGLTDIWVHTFLESDPLRMDWEELEKSARSKISDSACRRCHQNLTPKGASIKTIMAHREVARMKTPRRCVECHRTEFHGQFKIYLRDKATALADGEKK